MRWRWLTVLLVAGCFPYRQIYRPAFGGAVVDASAAPLAVAAVEVCTTTHWRGLSQGCLRRAYATTDAAGRFSFEGYKEWDWCCLGEAPMPFSVVIACTRDGRVGVERIGEAAPADLRVVVAPRREDASVPGDDPAAFAGRECARLLAP